MRFGIWSYFTLYCNTICSQSLTLNNDKPLHIGVSITFASRSHIKYLLEICEVLSERGHRITYLSTDQFKHFGEGYNVTHVSLGNAVMKREDFGEMEPFTSKDNIYDVYNDLAPTIATLYETTFPIYEEFYSDQTPDLMICDFMANSCIESAARNSIPLVMGYQSLMFSIPVPYLTINGGLEPTTIENYTFLQRLKHAIIDPLLLLKNTMPIVNSVAKFREQYSIPKEYAMPLFGHMGLSIANTYIGFENPRKTPSHVHVIGPILSDRVESLTEELESFLDNHQRVLYVAFGSMVHMRPELSTNMLQHFQRALNEGIIDGIIWGGLANTNLESFPKIYKVDDLEYSTSEMLEDQHPDIKLMKWAPQEAVLNHPNSKLFLSHGGLDSIYESLRSGTPMLVLPFFGDQVRNAVLIAENGVGDYIEWPTMSDAVIYQKFATLLDPDNLELRSKVRQLQLITKFSGSRKVMTADLIETYVLSAKSCREFETPKPFESPCEMRPFLPLDFKISSIKANLIDVYVFTVILISSSIFGLFYIVWTSSTRLFKKSKKQKSE